MLADENLSGAIDVEVGGHDRRSYAQLGRIDDAQSEAQAFKDAVIEGYSVQDYIAMDLPMYGEQSIKDHWLKGYRKAGLLE